MDRVEEHQQSHDFISRWHERRYRKFDRYTFDPNHYIDRTILNTLRAKGKSRRRCFLSHDYREQNFFCCRSKALEALHLSNNLSNNETWGGFYLDLGCGDSPDAAIAREWGYSGYGVDLFPPSADKENGLDYPSVHFWQGDVVSRIPMSDESIHAASSHAMLALIKPDERPLFYKEVRRVLKPGGLFACSMVELINGYPCTLSHERSKCESAGFRYVRAFEYGFVVRKR